MKSEIQVLAELELAEENDLMLNGKAHMSARPDASCDLCVTAWGLRWMAGLSARGDDSNTPLCTAYMQTPKLKSLNHKFEGNRARLNDLSQI